MNREIGIADLFATCGLAMMIIFGAFLIGIDVSENRNKTTSEVPSLPTSDTIIDAVHGSPGCPDRARDIVTFAAANGIEARYIVGDYTMTMTGIGATSTEEFYEFEITLGWDGGSGNWKVLDQRWTPVVPSG